MKKIALMLLVCWAAIQLQATEPKDSQWLTDLPKAQAKAKVEKKMVLVDFTGSDWCPPCMALKKGIFMSAEFQEYAATNLVLVEVDFPRKKAQTPELAQANKELAQKFNVDGFPTVIVFDSNGKQLSRDTGFGGGTAKEFVAQIESFKAK